MASEKPDVTPEASNFEGHEEPRRSFRSVRIAESVRLGLTALTLLMALSIVGMTADSLAVYNKTHVSEDYLLPLWPVQFNLGPTIALVTGGSIIILSNTMSLVGSRVPAVRLHISSQNDALANSCGMQIRNKALIHPIISLLAPLASLIAALVATSFFYSINTSDTVDTLQSWTCRWVDVPMTRAPYWNVLCKESKAALYMSITMIPLQLIIVGLAGFAIFADKKAPFAARKGSPALS